MKYAAPLICFFAEFLMDFIFIIMSYVLPVNSYKSKYNAVFDYKMYFSKKFYVTIVAPLLNHCFG